MIYEVRTYDLKPGSLPEVEKRFGEAYEKSRKFLELAAFWHTDIGPLNQIIHVWPYRDLEERAKIRAAAISEGTWPPKIGEFIVKTRSDIMKPFAISPELRPGKMGPYFEMRIYQYATGELPKIIEAWEKTLPARLKYSPLCAAWYSELGELNQFVHIWPYPSLDARIRIRQEMQVAGVWPPPVAARKQEGIPSYEMIKQESKILMPASFSPLQ